MIQALWCIDPNCCWLRCEGHADYAEKGKDIVCSMASVLVQALDAFLCLHWPGRVATHINHETAQMHITFDPLGAEGAELAIGCFEFVGFGLRLLEDCFPQNVSAKKVQMVG